MKNTAIVPETNFQSDIWKTLYFRISYLFITSFDNKEPLVWFHFRSFIM